MSVASELLALYQTKLANMFTNCYSLRSVTAMGVKQSFNVADLVWRIVTWKLVR